MMANSSSFLSPFQWQKIVEEVMALQAIDGFALAGKLVLAIASVFASLK